MVAHGGLPPVCYEILQDRAGEQTPSQTRVSLGQADPHENSGVWKQMQSTAVEIGVQTVGIKTLVMEADLEFDLEASFVVHLEQAVQFGTHARAVFEW